MKIPQRQTLALFSFATALTCSAQTTTLVRYLNSTSASFTSAATLIDPLLASAGAFALPTGLTVGTDTGFSTAASTRNVYLRTDHIAIDEPTAANLSGRFFSFTLTPGSTPIRFETITFGLGVSADRTGIPNESGTAFVRTSLDGFASTIGTSVGLSNVAVPLHASWPSTIAAQSISFGASLANVSVPVTFRIYLTDTLNSTNTSMRLTNLQITGSAIPEPSTSALAASGMIGMFTVVFRRRRNARVPA